VFLLIDLRWRDSEVLKAGYWLVGRELLTTDSVKRTPYGTRQTGNSQAGHLLKYSLNRDGRQLTINVEFPQGDKKMLWHEVWPGILATSFLTDHS